MRVSEEEEKPVVVATIPLNEREERAYQFHMEAFRAGKEYALAPTVEAGLFELFLNGVPLEDIQRLNRGYRLGQIVRSAVEGGWHERKRDYTKKLMEAVEPRVQQVQSEAVAFASDLLAAAHKQHGDRLRRFLQTGDEKDLGDFSLSDLGKYAKGVELLLKLTGQDGAPKRKAGLEEPPVPPKGAGAQTQLPPRPLAPTEAEEMLRQLQGEPKK